MLRPSLPSLLLLSGLPISLCFVIYPEAFLQPAAQITPSPRLHALPTVHPKSIDPSTLRKCPYADRLTSAPEALPVIQLVEVPNKPRSSLQTFSDGDEDDNDEIPLPVLIWHGLGDSASSDGIKDIASLLDEVHAGTHTFLVSLAEGRADSQASFFGNLTAQVEQVCKAISNDNILRTAPAIDMLGFSQGGQFLRGLIETCPPETLGRVRSLLTMGSQHNGISKFQRCSPKGGDWVCRAAEALVSSGGVWSNLVQSGIVPAQYFRDPTDLEPYLAHSAWLADINNERNQSRNPAYAARLASLQNLVMVLFEDDQTVVPKQSSWFADVDPDTNTVTNLTDRAIYREDWIGLKQLHERGGLTFELVQGGHMQLDDKDLRRMFARYYGPLGRDRKQSQIRKQGVDRWSNVVDVVPDSRIWQSDL